MFPVIDLVAPKLVRPSRATPGHMYTTVVTRRHSGSAGKGRARLHVAQLLLVCNLGLKGLGFWV